MENLWFAIAVIACAGLSGPFFLIGEWTRGD